MWYCDKCGEPIKSVEEGYVEWKRTGSDIVDSSEDLKLVHQNGCLYDEKVERQNGYAVPGSHLKEFVGRDGLMQCLVYLQNREFKDPNEMYELIKRLHVPNYEEARIHFKEAYQDGYIDNGQLKEHIVYSKSLEYIVKKYGESK